MGPLRRHGDCLQPDDQGSGQVATGQGCRPETVFLKVHLGKARVGLTGWQVAGCAWGAFGVLVLGAGLSLGALGAGRPFFLTPRTRREACGREGPKPVHSYAWTLLSQVLRCGGGQWWLHGHFLPCMHNT